MQQHCVFNVSDTRQTLLMSDHTRVAPTAAAMHVVPIELACARLRA